MSDQTTKQQAVQGAGENLARIAATTEAMNQALRVIQYEAEKGRKILRRVELASTWLVFIATTNAMAVLGGERMHEHGEEGIPLAYAAAITPIVVFVKWILTIDVNNPFYTAAVGKVPTLSSVEIPRPSEGHR
jgi:hypothetical protein